MNIPFLGKIGLDGKTGMIIAVAGAAAFLIAHHTATSDPKNKMISELKKQGLTTAEANKVADNYFIRDFRGADQTQYPHGVTVPVSTGASPLVRNAHGISAYSSRAYDATTTSTVTPTDPAVVTLQNRILSIITQRAQNITSVIPNIDTIKAEIATHAGQLATAVAQQKAGVINAAMIEQYLQSIVSDVATKLQIALNDLPSNTVPDYYQQYYQQYQQYQNQLNNNYYDYYQTPYQYYPGTQYDYYQPYQYQYPSPYYGAGQYPYSYPNYGSQQYSSYPSYNNYYDLYKYYYPQQTQTQSNGINVGGLIHVGSDGIRIGSGSGGGGLFGGLF